MIEVQIFLLNVTVFQCQFCIYQSLSNLKERNISRKTTEILHKMKSNHSNSGLGQCGFKKSNSNCACDVPVDAAEFSAAQQSMNTNRNVNVIMATKYIKNQSARRYNKGSNNDLKPQLRPATNTYVKNQIIPHCFLATGQNKTNIP